MNDDRTTERPVDDAGSRDPRPGDHIGDYELLEQIGAGGMGIVFRARDPHLGQVFALKCPLPAHTSDPKLEKRALREARSMARIRHPNIVQVFQALEVDGRPWIVMQWVEGSNLREILEEEGRLPTLRVVQYAEKLAAALDCAHSRNVLHRDIKPGNVLVTPDGEPLLTDFGLARPLVRHQPGTVGLTSLDDISEPGELRGTPRYMSPEQILDQPLDERSDIFSLGTLIYEMCTGEPAFKATRQGGVLHSVIHDDPEPLSRYLFRVPEELQRIIRKCLAKSPAERYQSARDLLVDLRALRQEIEFKDYVSQHPTQIAEINRHRIRSLLWAVGAALVVVVVAWLVWPESATNGIPASRSVRVTALPGWEGQPALSADGSRIAYSSDASGNREIYLIGVHGGQPLRLTQNEASDEDPCWFPDGSAIAFTSNRRGNPGIWRVDQFGGGETLLVAGGFEPSISPDGTAISYVTSNENGQLRIAVAPLEDLTLARVITGDDDGAWSHRDPDWSPDGRWICYSARHGLWKIRADGSQATQITHSSKPDRQPVWSPDGSWIYFASHREGTLALWRVDASGAEPERVTLGSGPESAPSLSSDGSRLIYSTERILHNVAVAKANAEGWDLAEVPSLQDDWMPTIAPDGSRMVFVSDRWGSNLELWTQDLEEGYPKGDPRKLIGQLGDASYPQFSPDGRWIAYYRILSGERELWMIDVRAGTQSQFLEDPADESQPCWSRDGRELSFLSNRSGDWQVWTVGFGEGEPIGEPVQLTEDPEGALLPRWSPRGELLAYVGGPGHAMEVYVVQRSVPLESRAVTSGAQVDAFAWDPTGETLLVAGYWGGEQIVVHTVDLDGNRIPGRFDGLVLGTEDGYNKFDLSADGEVLVFTQDRLSGDLWMLETITEPF